MNCIELVESINEHLPTVDQIKKKLTANGSNFSDDYFVNYKNERKLLINSDVNNVSDELEYLINNTNVGLIGIGSINFLSKLRNLGDGIWQFSSYNDYFLTCYSKNDQQIFNSVIDEDHYELICGSISDYFEFLDIVSMQYNSQVWGVEFSKELASVKLNNLLNSGFSEKWMSEILTDWPW